MGKIWVCSDLHLCHDRAFVYMARGFVSVHEMNAAIERNWKRVVGTDDDVYVLGDLILNDIEEGLRIVQSLPGRIHLVLGNHDTDAKVEVYRTCANIVEIERVIVLKYRGVRLYMTHYPTLVGNFDDGRSLKRGLLNLCGHSHVIDPFADWCDRGRIYHVEMEAHSCTPVSLDEILENCRHKIEEG